MDDEGNVVARVDYSEKRKLYQIRAYDPIRRTHASSIPRRPMTPRWESSGFSERKAS